MLRTRKDYKKVKDDEEDVWRDEGKEEELTEK